MMMDDMDRFHLVKDVIDHVPSLGSRAALLRQQMVDARAAGRPWPRVYRDDILSVRNWTWPAATGSGGGRRAPLPDTGADLTPEKALRRSCPAFRSRRSCWDATVNTMR